jgi:carboxypeptidase C (cathepsin A)
MPLPLPSAAPAYAYLARNPLYLTGESFAGHYIPAIAAYMRLKSPSLKLAGVAMGNPCTSAPAM